MKYVNPIKKIILVNYLMFLTICPVLGQIVNSKKVTQSDFSLWSTISDTKLSPQGNWISFTLSYESKKDTLFLKDTNSGKVINLPFGTNPMFLNDEKFAYKLPENHFELIDLKSCKQTKFDQISNFSPVYQGVLLEKVAVNNRFVLQVINYDGNILHTLTDVTYYKLDPTGTKLVYVTAGNNSLVLLDLIYKNEKFTLANDATTFFSIVKWHENGTSIVFVGTKKNEGKTIYDKVYFYDLKHKRIAIFDPKVSSAIPKSMELNAQYLNQLYIAKDEQSVYFKIKTEKETKSAEMDSVQIWNAADKNLYPQRMLFGSSMSDSRLVKWTIKSNEITIIGDNEHPIAYGHLNQPNMIIYNEDENKPFFTSYPNYTFWLFNTVTKEKSLFLKELSGRGYLYNFSPQGKYFVYSKDLNWWVYSFDSKQHINITAKYNGQFVNQTDRSYGRALYNFAGWSENDEFLYIYDEFDIWEFNAKTGIGMPITKGRNNKEINRLTTESRLPQEGLISTETTPIIPGKNFTIRVTKANNTFSGFSYVDKEKKVQKIAYEPQSLSNLQKAKNADVYLFTAEDFKIPPALYIVKGHKNKVLYRSNSHYKHFVQGDSKLIEYTNKKGKILNGVLLFPANYNPELKYPMIVYVYEKLTRELHHYSNPSYLNGSTINFANLVNEGYFVLLPDIDYELGNPGFSAVDCVTSAVEKTLANYPINQKKIGLTGHSYGGYVTDFIITQSNIFAAAAAGAAVTHFNSNYLDLTYGSFQPLSWFYEYHQMRMGKTLFADYDGYQKNSPLTHAANINTPLLAYTGSADMQVSSKQSLEFYIALRRLQKEHILLIYPKENHVFSGLKAQVDLSHKLMDWFGYFLKDEKPADWITNGSK